MEKNTKQKNKKIKREKKHITLFGYSIWRLIAYFAIYSFLGFIIETLFGLLTKGALESRKSFLYGPFCGIYGLGAIVMVICLQYFKKNNYTLFFGGFLVGSIVEYIVSLVGELVFHVKWWDYSSVPLNLNGRVCVFFSLFWGILAIYLMVHIHPKVDQFIDKIKERYPHPKVLKGITLGILLFFIIDASITGFALRMFYTRLTTNYHLDIQGVDEYLVDYEEMYQNPTIKKIVDTFFHDKKMLKTFPNLKLTAKNGDILYVSDILKDIQPYYIRIFTPRVPGAIIQGNE